MYMEGRVTDLGEKSGMPDTEENIIVHHLTLLRSAAKASKKPVSPRSCP